MLFLKYYLRGILSLIFFSCSFTYASDTFPVSYKGRFRAAEAYASLWLEELYHAPVIHPSHLPAFSLSSHQTPLDFIWMLQAFGHAPFNASPLFWVASAELKALAQLNPTQTHFSYQELSHAFYTNRLSNKNILKRLLSYHFFKAYSDPANRNHATTLELEKLSPGLWIRLVESDLIILSLPSHPLWHHWQVGERIEALTKSDEKKILQKDKKFVEEFLLLLTKLKHFEELKGSTSHQVFSMDQPLQQHLRQTGSLLKVLPGRYQPGEWYSLQALKMQVSDASKTHSTPISNFTIYSDADFEAIRHSYLNWEQAMEQDPKGVITKQLHLDLIAQLNSAYQKIAGTIYQKAQGKSLVYPSSFQLTVESFYTTWPIIEIVTFVYGAAIVVGLLAYLLQSSLLKVIFIGITGLAFILHTMILVIRCYILARPPVSNMLETLIYVPWITMLVSFALTLWLKHLRPLLAANFTAFILFSIILWTGIHPGLENVQAVLDSQFWLIVHVLMVVGSYGVFILGGILGHVYLSSSINTESSSSSLHKLAHAILQTMYLGTALLVSGTILGGVWAAESWGRFWDWDPKESWAFISACAYLLTIHAYRFHKIGDFGLAVGAIIGFLAISFTWYGVNYILGTGLHSYGFGLGGEIYYACFILLEILFLSYILWKRKKRMAY